MSHEPLLGLVREGNEHPAAGEPDLDAVQRLALATCAELHRRALESGYLVRPYKKPHLYRSRQVFPMIYAALATGLIQEVPHQ